MKRHLNIFIQFLFLLMTVCTSCIDEPLYEAPQDNRLWFTISTSEEGIINTRAGGQDPEQTIANVFVFLFETNNQDPGAAKLLEWHEANSSGQGKWSASMTSSSGTMYVFANVVSQVWENTIPTVEWINDHIKTFDDIKNFLIPQVMMQKQADNSYLITSDPMTPTMISEPKEYTTGTMHFDLTRIVAKVTVKNDSKNESYKLQGINLGNAPVAGYAYTNATSPQTIPTGYYAGQSGTSGTTSTSYSIEDMMREVNETDSTQTKPIYLYESPKKNETFAIIKGTYDGVTGYHKLALWQQNATTKLMEYLDIERNKQYIIHINKVSSAGYRTAAEAIKNKPSNQYIDYNITVTDPSSHDIVTNGEEYLGVSNSGLIIYQSGDFDIEATKISYTVNSQWQAGEITTEGTGLSFTNSTTTMPLDVNNTSNKSITIRCTSAFTEGSLSIRIGNLAKVIRISRYGDKAAVPDEMVFPDATIGDCSASGAEKYHIAFAKESGVYPNEYTEQGDIFNSGGDTLYTLLSANIGYKTNASVRNGEFYVVNAKKEGRTKVVYRQQFLNVDDQKNYQIRPYTYVGTFHRAYETAERIIRIASIDGANTEWSAIVIVGRDFIELDTHPSIDPGIHMDQPYGYNETDSTDVSQYDRATYTTAEDVDKYCQFGAKEKGKTVISGRTSPNGTIFFRVGMKSKLAEKDAAADTPPRYGLIALIHGTAQALHLIYVRQGEAADYLMRPMDPIEGSSIQRTKAIKMKPYNMTSPDQTKLYYDVPVNGGAYTEYPSQGGYFFQGQSRRAYYPIGRISQVGGWGGGSSTSTGDVCPDGYRRPKDGDTSNFGLVNGSEIRQSLWLNPKDGEAQSDFGNMLRGYIADGYYDRRVMRIPDAPNPRTTPLIYNEGLRDVYKSEVVQVNGKNKYFSVPTMVGDGAEVAYAGVLLYNPNNYASIFVPGNGSRAGQFIPGGSLGDIRGTGAESNLWTSSIKSGGQLWYLATGYYFNAYVLDNYASAASEGFSVRCVKKATGEP